MKGGYGRDAGTGASNQPAVMRSKSGMFLCSAQSSGLSSLSSTAVVECGNDGSAVPQRTESPKGGRVSGMLRRARLQLLGH